MQSKVFVTGGTGFLGQHLLHRLVEMGYSIHLLSRSEPVMLKRLYKDKIIWCQGDLSLSKDQLSSFMRGVERVYHLAGLIGYREELYDQMMEINVEGTRKVAKAAVSVDVPELIYISSVAAIGASRSPTAILSEESPFNMAGKDFGYFYSKHLAEQALIQETDDFPIRSFMLNPSTIWGAGDFAKDSRKIQKKVALGKFPFHTSGGVNVVHVQDVIDAIIKLPKMGKKNRRYIIGAKNLLIKDLFNLIRVAAGLKPSSILIPNFILYGMAGLSELLKPMGLSLGVHMGTVKVSTMYHWFDNSRSVFELGMSYRSVDEAVEESIRWLKENGSH